VGFGGTVNLVVGLLFLIGAVALMSGPYHGFMAAARPLPGEVLDSPGPIHVLAWPVVGVSVFMGVALGAAVTLIPLRWGVGRCGEWSSRVSRDAEPSERSAPLRKASRRG